MKPQSVSAPARMRAGVLTAGSALFIIDAALIAVVWPVTLWLAVDVPGAGHGLFQAYVFGVMDLVFLFALGLYRRDSIANPPLAAIDEQQRAKDLHQHQSEQQVSHAAHRAGHDRPAAVQVPALLALLVALQREVLDPPKTQTDHAASEEPGEGANNIHQLHIYPVCFALGLGVTNALRERSRLSRSDARLPLNPT